MRCSTRWSPALRWDEKIKRWRVGTSRGDEIRARFVVMANGFLNIAEAAGHPRHRATSRGRCSTRRAGSMRIPAERSKNPVLDKLTDKRVAIIGTGATAIQAIPFLGRYAKQLYVIQRTPSTVDERPNPPTDPEWVKSLKPGWQKERQANFHRAAMEFFKPGRAGPDLRHLDRDQPQPGCGARGRGLAPAHARGVHGTTRSGRLPGDGAPAPPRCSRRQRSGNGRGIETVVPLPLQASAVERRILSDLQPSQRQADRRFGDQGRRAHDRKRFCRGRRRIPGRLHDLRQRFRGLERPGSPLGHRCDRRPWRKVDLPALGRRPQDAPRRDRRTGSRIYFTRDISRAV